MDLKTLAELTGTKSISDMTDEELLEHVRMRRNSRMVVKASDLKRSEKTTTVRKERKAKMPSIDNMSDAEIEALLAKIAKPGS